VKHGRSNNGDVEGAEEDKEWRSISTPREVPSSCSAVVALMVGCYGLAAALLTGGAYAYLQQVDHTTRRASFDAIISSLFILQPSVL